MVNLISFGFGHGSKKDIRFILRGFFVLLLLFSLGIYVMVLSVNWMEKFVSRNEFQIISPQCAWAVEEPGSLDILRTGYMSLAGYYREDRVIALTFDDGPYPLYTPLLVDILNRKGVRATFFVIGEDVEKFGSLLELIDQGGHQIGSHTYHHRSIDNLKGEEIKEELQRTDLLVEEITGKKPILFRPPGGRIDPFSRRTVLDYGHVIVMYSINPGDYWQRDPNILYKDIFEKAHPGGIIVLHSGLIQTIRLMPTLIYEFRRKGYRFVTVSELAKIKGIPLPEEDEKK